MGLQRFLCLPILLVLFVSRVFAGDFTFIHVSDLHVGSGKNAEKDIELFKEISNLSPKPAFIAGTGDLCELGTPPQYKLYQEILPNLTLKSFQAPGNHDVRWNPLGKEGFVKGAKQPMYQAWTHEGIRFVLLDSTTLLQHWGHFDADMLEWLKKDLRAWGTDKPVIIGFHHWIGREGMQVDNEQELMDLVAPYNVRLWLQGHGHSNIQWNINGTPAIMVQGLYQGAYNIVTIKGGTLNVSRRFLDVPPKKKKQEAASAPAAAATSPAGEGEDSKDADPAATPAAAKEEPELLDEKPAAIKVKHADVLSVSLKKPVAPRWDARFEPNAVVKVLPGNLPTGTELSMRIDQGKYEAMKAAEGGWISVADPSHAGQHTITVQAKLPDGRCYQKPLIMTLDKSGVPSTTWEKNIGAAVMTRLVRSGTTLFVPSMDGDLVAMNPATGMEKWRFKTAGSIFATPEVINNVVYFGSADHYIYAVDATTGKLKWKTPTQGAVFGGASVAKDVVCIASCDRKIYGLDAADGSVRWTVPTGGMTQSKVATDGTLFFVGTWDNSFRAIDAATGNVVWSHKFGKSKSGAFSFYFAPAIGAPAVGDGKVFISSNDGLLHAVDIASGKLAWETPQSHQLGYCSPLHRDGKVYQSSLGGMVYCFNAADGEILWKTPTGSSIYDSSPAYASGNIYIGRVDGVFTSLNAASGKLLWQRDLGTGHVLASPTTDENKVYIGSMSGKITALPLR